MRESVQIAGTGAMIILMGLLTLTGCDEVSEERVISSEQDSGGVLPPQQAAYDVTFYDLAVSVHPEEQTIEGRLRAVASVEEPLDVYLLDLDQRLEVDSVRLGRDDTFFATDFEHENNRLTVDLPEGASPGDTVVVEVFYGGAPRIAPNAPWDGGFSWAETPRGAPWIATSVQLQGADLWWPVKDHPSDEPDSMAIHVRVPEPLVVASNGVLRGIEMHDDTTRTYNWFVSTPINNYSVALNIAPYDTVQATYTSITGQAIPATFWVLPSRLEDARRVFPAFLDHVRFLEELLGPYPFRADKYGVAHVPFLGMEHQTIIAYGSDFGDAEGNEVGYFDWLHFHELAHEWWGNVVTARDWKDFWIHEGAATYMGALYAEHLGGEPALNAAMAQMQEGIEGHQPIAWREPRTTEEYNGDIYDRGGAMLHTLRYLVGDDAFFEILRTFIYPTDELRRATEGRQTRLVDTDDFIRVAEDVSGRELNWFFDAYLYRSDLPRLEAEVVDDTLRLSWNVPADARFPMPIDVQLGETTRRVEMTRGSAEIPLEGETWEVDPESWVLRAELID